MLKPESLISQVDCYKMIFLYILTCFARIISIACLMRYLKRYGTGLTWKEVYNILLM